MGLRTGLFGKRKAEADSELEVAAVYRDLRTQALQLRETDIAAAVVSVSPVLAVLMETGYPEAIATLVAVSDGTTSLYFSSGGGIIGAGDHEPVRLASFTFLATAVQHLPALAPTDDRALPGTGCVRFFVVTKDGVRAAEESEEHLAQGSHALSPLFLAGHDVLTAVRENTSQ